jgi:lysozyme
MKEFEKLINVIKKHEGLSLYAYSDSLGYITIGYGRCIDKRSKGINLKEAEFLLFNDLMECEELAKKFKFFNSLDEVRKHVIIELIFNLGFDGFSKFKKTIALIENKKYIIQVYPTEKNIGYDIDQEIRKVYLEKGNIEKIEWNISKYSVG